jgi:type IX secretion system PorP/SprF family membrane protein
MKKIFFYSVFLLFSLGSVAQDIHFSQVLNNPLHINPANTGGYRGYERLIVNYRSQWATFGSPYRTGGFSFDMPMWQKKDKAHIGVGINFFTDKAGDSKMGISQGNLSLSCILPMDEKNTIIAGLQYGYGQRSMDLSGVLFESQFNGQEFDPTLPNFEGASQGSFGYSDLGVGVRYEFNNTDSHFKGWDINRLDVGLALYHVNKPTLKYFSGSDEVLDMKIVGHFNGRFDLPSSVYSIVPYGYFFLQNEFKEINVGMLVRMELAPGTKITGLLNEAALYFGGHFRVGDAIVPQVMLEWYNFGVGLSYDANISSLKTVSRYKGGLEISLKYHILKGALFKNRSGNSIFGN